MKRQKTTGILLLLISLCALAALLITDSRRPRLSALMITDEEAEAITSARQPSDLRLLRSLHFNDYPLFFDEGADTFYYSLIRGDSTASDPQVKAETGGSGIRVVFRTGAINSETIGNNVPLSVIAYDRENYREYRVYCTTLPLMNIESEIEFIHGTQKDRDLKMTLLDNRQEARQHLIRAEGVIHVRGNDSTTVFPKQAYKMTLYQDSPGGNPRELKQSLLGMREDGEWLLYAGYNDQERIRNVFSSALWNRTNAGENEFGIPNGMEYRFLELFMNGKYWGLYAIGYPLDSGQMIPMKHTEDVERIYIFKKAFWAEEYSKLPAELQMRDYEIKGDDTRTHETEARALLKTYDDWLLARLNGSGSAGSPVSADMQNAIDTWLFVALTQGYDTVWPTSEFVNMFLTIIQCKDRAAAIYTPWDLDLTWGNLRRTDAKNTTVPYGIRSDDNSFLMLRNPAHFLLTEDPDRLRSRYFELRSGGWSDEAAETLIRGFETDIFDSGAYLRDMEKWPEASNGDPMLKLQTFTAYVRERFRAMDAFAESWGK